jgi:excisionase family DNA binding protein
MIEFEKRQKLTPPEVAKLLRIGNNKVLSMIRSGELRAIDIATPGSKRPRFRINEADLHACEAGREVVAPPKPTPRKKRPEAAGVKQYF